MRFKSCAKWPAGTVPHCNDVTRAVEYDQKQAEMICRSLQREGYAGEKKVFPVKTWVEKEEY